MSIIDDHNANIDLKCNFWTNLQQHVWKLICDLRNM